MVGLVSCFFFFFFNDTATTEIYTLSLHDALPISRRGKGMFGILRMDGCVVDLPLVFSTLADRRPADGLALDRKSTRLNSSHGYISYAVFCLKKKKKENTDVDAHIQ